MNKLESKIYDEISGLDYVLAGGYYHSRYRCLVHQTTENEGVTEDLKRQSQWEWAGAMNSIVSRAEESIKSELINA